MTNLRRLTLITAPEFPSSFASGLTVVTRLRRLALLQVGLGVGAVEALKRLQSAVARALPRCRFEALPDPHALPWDADAVYARGAAPARAAACRGDAQGAFRLRPSAAGGGAVRGLGCGVGSGRAGECGDGNDSDDGLTMWDASPRVDAGGPLAGCMQGQGGMRLVRTNWPAW
ncbi:hypothetical protein MNEG_12726 [Monoraphidium neglectum]|jgi:hypothetical protein|uniref:Uncharacterized protein n=1 Tax=Monoraphidium neglectum TaxID=145388 RepID=A0A0D2J5T4_9CHLO|nr:hypothetical protein MNEG_12726 [Monoraphidium neglectum]KIY95237.1 hypothetical protein MNEG_12726 [Monoraphidium neglectum]|eukprot:XP_013894257.1 hypothetical protein MNEG_12726 [Monoraphidium neglectum]